ncbi:PREDICTED: probable LRR receptor-like serine/threonine-protein kinase At4g36180 [Ipomoea nil]|uniref:probable LRR receptor-like serine/threonine-protein kinase At4g36180 n=1 Tax=Ipomoea nil TaxID=35883 RepID=UPI000901B815|nr:PREDICTED: probable LRR receptor-like serine/threonine-protein kinase At4g36180 [Ipomoea nil]
MGTTFVHQTSYFFIILFAFVLMELCNCSGSNNLGVCKEREMQALLCFKKEFEDPMNRLSSWVDGVDCCTKWEGVMCDNVTGHVVQLRLTNPNFDFEFVHLPKGTLSPCLLELKQLHHLDLSGLYRYFSGSRIPNFIGSFANLQYLDLSNLGFQGIIPPQLGNLTSLHTLILQLNFDDTSHASLIKTKSLDWLSNLSNLQLLDLSYVNLSMAHNWLEAINMLPSLRELHLSYCDLPKLSQSLRLLNNSLLEVLDLSNNEFNTVIPKWMFNLNNLVSLDLTSSGFLSPLPDGPWNLTSIITLNISGNEMNGSLPSQLFGLSGLVSMNLRGNQFQGSLPNGPWNLTSLGILDISSNKLNGSLPHQLFGLSHLASLDISFNQLQDPLPNGFSNLTFLKNLDVSGNRMNSHIPNQIYDLTNLESLRLSDNQLQGTISNSISNLTSLSVLYLSGNMLTGEIPKQIGNLNKLQELYLSGNMLTGEIPKQIGNLNKLQELYLSGNMLTGEIPKQFGILSKLQVLDLSTNRLCGPLPENLGYSFPTIESLYISYNKLEGIVTENHFVNLTKLTILDASENRLTMRVNPNWTPPFQLHRLDLSGWNLGPQFPLWLQSQHQIYAVDISNAGIEGELPTWLWNFSSQIELVNVSHNQLRGQIQNIPSHSTGEIGMSLSVYLSSNQFSGPLPHISIHIIELDLSNNSFSGNISNFLCHAQKVQYDLRILHLGGNDLFGEIPDCWMHWPYLEVLNMKENKLTGSIPNSISLLSHLESLDMHKNMLSGPIPSLQNCSFLLKVDLAENGFTGKISRWLGTSLSHLIILRLRSNKFNGELSPEFCHLTSLRILDISNNNFSGVIPKCLKNLTAMINEGELSNIFLERGYSLYGRGFGESALVTTKGHEYEYCTIILMLLVSMDFSSNNFNGEIPIELTNLVRLRSLNLSGNKLTGNIPMEMGNMKLLESIDLSRNQLSGKIPSSFSSLSSLGVLDLSYNNLSGEIPLGTQLQGFNVSCYIGNNLCGPPLSKSCSVDDGEILKNENRRDDGCEVDWFYVSMVIGFAVGFGCIYGSLLLVKSWRIAYFKFLDKKLKSFLVWAHALSA